MTEILLLDRTWGTPSTQIINMGFFVFGRSYHAEFCSRVNYSDQFGFNELFDAI